MKLDAKGIYYQELNRKIRQAIESGEKEIILDNVSGQRYIGGGIKAAVKMRINGTPGNDLAAFMDGPEIIVFGNGQDAIGNTMSAGKVVIHGDAGDIVGYGMRGGKIFIKGNVGYRVGIHMKEYKDIKPTIVIGGNTGDFLGEYMAGGILVVLGEEVGNFCGTGMHGGVMYVNGSIPEHKLGKEVKVLTLDREDEEKLEKILREYAEDMVLEYRQLARIRFTKLVAGSTRPYGKLYAY